MDSELVRKASTLRELDRLGVYLNTSINSIDHWSEITGMAPEIYHSISAYEKKYPDNFQAKRTECWLRAREFIISNLKYGAYRNCDVAYQLASLAVDALTEWPYWNDKFTASAMNYLSNKFSKLIPKSASGSSFVILDRNFPFSARQLSLEWVNKLEHLKKFARRFSQDLSQVSELLGEKFIEVTLVEFGCSDPHDNGQDVVRICVGEKSIYYKPRSAAMDLELAGVLKGVGGDRFSQYHASFSDRGDYYWVRGFSRIALSSRAEGQRFFEQFGQLLACAHALGICDLHSDNVIASEAGPIIVDTEVSFNGWLDAVNFSSWEGRLLLSVLRSGALPNWEKGAGDLLFDHSALGYTDLPSWGVRAAYEGTASDALEIERGRIRSAVNFPIYNGVPPSPWANAEAIVRSFRLTWGKLLKVSGIDDVHSVRFVFRDTHVYRQLYEDISAIDCFEAATLAGYHLDGLAAPIFGPDALRHQRVWPLIRSEQSAMLRGDYPRFMISSGSGLFSENREPVGFRALTTGIECYEARINAFREPLALNFECQLIKATLLTTGSSRCSDDLSMVPAWEIGALLDQLYDCAFSLGDGYLSWLHLPIEWSNFDPPLVELVGSDQSNEVSTMDWWFHALKHEGYTHPLFEWKVGRLERSEEAFSHAMVISLVERYGSLFPVSLRHKIFTFLEGSSLDEMLAREILDDVLSDSVVRSNGIGIDLVYRLSSVLRCDLARGKAEELLRSAWNCASLWHLGGPTGLIHLCILRSVWAVS